MGFLKKTNAPSELPDLAMDNVSKTIPVAAQPKPITTQPIVKDVPVPIATPDTPKEPQENKAEPVKVKAEPVKPPAKDTPIDSSVKKLIEEKAWESGFEKNSFFDEVLEDINGGISDVGKLEDWYEKKFVKEDVVSNMKGYWEGNKADIIIQSFGAEYKAQIKEKIKTLQGLEEDWREIYFKLIKKEEEMKKEERELKETLSEFVNLCKRRKKNGKKKK